MIEQAGKILSNPDVLQMLAYSFIVASFIGAFLDRKGLDLIRWIVAVVTFAVLDAFGAVAVMGMVTKSVAPGVAIFTVIFSLNYCAGLAVGWYVVSLAKQRAGHAIDKRSAMDEGISITQVKRNQKATQDYISNTVTETGQHDKGSSTSQTTTTTTTTTTKKDTGKT